MSKKLVAYFSASGVTKRVAEKLAEIAGADVFEIKPVQEYTRADLNWMDKKSRTSIEKENPSLRPEIADKVGNMEKYDVVFVGFPIWWYVAPNIINTFMESYDFSGKTIIPFATSGGSGFGRTVEVLQPLCSDTAKWADGKMLNRASHKEISNWLKSMEEMYF